MQTDVIQAIDLGGTVPNFTVWGMVSQADPVVQLVMLILVLASFWSWAIIVEKIMKIRRITGQADNFEETFWSGSSLDDLYERTSHSPDHPLALVFMAAMREWQRSVTGKGAIIDRLGVQDRIAKVMRVAIHREMERLERHTTFLATVGSTAPFLGLFGTVWGIMNSFQAIALTSNTSLAVVAPGIAEALLATALGLVAAIPAVVAYNKLSADMGQYAGRLDGFADEFWAILSRQLEERVG